MELLREVIIDLTLDSAISVRVKTGCVISIGDEFSGPLWGLCIVSLTELTKWLLKTVTIPAGPLYRVPLSLISSCLVIFYVLSLLVYADSPRFCQSMTWI